MKLQLNRVLSLTSTKDILRPIVSDAEWESVIENQIETRAADFTREKYEPFKRRQFARFRRIHESGLGGRLVHEACLHGFSTWNLGTLVMVAADDYHAAGNLRIGRIRGERAITEQLYSSRT